MIEQTGKKVCGGIAIGKIKLYKKTDYREERREVQDPEAELQRFEKAREAAIAQLDALYQKALTEVGEEGAQLFEVHGMMIEDEDYNDSITEMIRREAVQAEYAVSVTGKNFADAFAAMEDEYFRARSLDIQDISERLIRVLRGIGDDTDLGDTPVILLAEDLVPSETVQMDKSLLLAIVTQLGSSNSHTAILARTMGIPSLIGIEIDPSWNGQLAVVDGYEGRLIINPEDALLGEYMKKKTADEDRKKLLQDLKGKENVTRSGQTIQLYANIGSPEDLGAVLANDAGGIGLFRSEFLYLNAKTWPTEEEQFEVYKKVLQTMAGKKVIVRTLDLGADKQAEYFNLGKEDNPALGYRAIRICLTRPEIFRTQLRALYRASSYGNLSIMYPMIISVEEVRAIREISKSVRAELEAEGVPMAEQVEEGIMIETPAAVWMSEELAEEVDFFSVGTNDLTQYTLAIDRQNAKLDDFYDPHHPAVMKELKVVVENAHKAGIWAGICGELGADTTLTDYFLEIGYDELSMSPSSILPVRKQVREH